MRLLRTALASLLIAGSALLPLAASAQTVTTPSNSALQAEILVLVAAIAKLEAQLAALNPSSTTTTPPTTGTPTTSSSICSVLTVNMSLGATDASTGGQVSKLQNNLAAAGYAVTVNGIYDLATQSAVGQYQTKNGIVSSGDRFTTGYGAVGPSTRAAMAKCAGVQDTSSMANPVHVTSFQVTPSTVQQYKDATVMFSWTSTGSDNCQLRNITNNGGLLIADAIGASGTRTMPQPQTTTTYQLYCTKTTFSGNVPTQVASDSLAQTVTVTPIATSAADMPTLTGISPSQGTTGTTITLSGTNLGNATEVDFYRLNGQLAATFPASSSGVSIASTHIAATIYGAFVGVAGPDTYQVKVVTPAGTSNGLPFTLTAPNTTAAAPTCTLTANPSSIAAGGSTTLTWSTTNATTAVLDYAGAVTVGSSGSVSVSPLSTHTYTLAVQGAGGTTSCTKTISVSATPTAVAPVINSFTASLSSIAAGQPVTLSWNSSNTANGGCYLYANNSSSTITPSSNWGGSGTFVVSPTVTTNYVLWCTPDWKDGSPTATKAVTVNVSAPVVGPAPNTSGSGLPDLSATVLGPSSAAVGQTVTVTGFIANNGDVGTNTGFNAVFVTDLNSSQTDWNTKNVVSVPPLSAHSNAQVSTTFSWSTPGTYQYALCADSSTLWAGTITESNEANNCSSHNTVVVTSPTRMATTNSNLASALAAIQSAIDALKSKYSLR